jgi:tetratricopeptide (TPR) repeat protein
MKPAVRFLCFITLTQIATCQQARTTSAPANRSQSSQVSRGNIDELAKKAEAAREADQTPEAIRFYKRLLQLKPESTEYWWYLGMLYYESDDYANGQAAFRHVTTGKPEMALGWAMLGLCEYETKDYGRALGHLAKADSLGIPRQGEFYPVAKYHLALLQTRAEDFESAATVIGEFAKAGKDSLQFTEAMGLACLRKPLLPQELPPLERELVLDVGHMMCDSVARRALDLDRDISELLKKYPDTPQIHFLVGSILVSSDPDRALQE